MAGLYVHIPFCGSRCIYCGFYSTTLSSLRGDYVKALCRELALRHDYIREPIETVYLGGGTPSQLGGEELEKLFGAIHIYNKVYGISTDAEITMECNPDDVTPDFAATISRLPVNRVSMGVQTFDDNRLRFIRRRHTAAQVHNAIGLLRHAGIGNISIDLMFGFPGETTEQWDKDITCALSLGVQHISAYALTFEEGTPLHAMMEHGEVAETDEETSRSMYYMLADRMCEAGYEHYEISNFARPGFRSRHNGSYWKGIPYIGIGAAAHSFDTVSRQWNIADVRRYMDSINRGIVLMEREELDMPARYNDMVMTSLRTCEGIDLHIMEERFGKEYVRYMLANADRHVSAGLLSLSKSHLRLTRDGLFVSDSVMCDLMKV